jgi:DNA polymerase (family 10)
MNQELAKIFYNIALYLEMDEVPFRPQAYEKAAVNLEILSEDVESLYKKGGPEALKKIPGVGESIAAHIIEYIKTGKIKEYEALRKKTPVNLEELTAIEGVGPKTVKVFYKKLGVRNLRDLGKAAKTGGIRNLPHFGLRTEQNILQSIEFLKRGKGRFLLGEILPKVYEITAKLKNLNEVKRISEAGSVRRRKETIGDVDILITSSNPQKVIDFFVKLPGAVKIWGKGPTKASIRLKEGFDVDLRVLPEKQFGSALQYFTGSKEHNIVLRKIAIDKGMKLSEYGLFRGAKPRRKTSGKMIAGETEKEVYEKLGLGYIEPELRENTGEIEAGQAHQLPQLIGYNDIKGDLHVHSDWDAPKESKLPTGQGGRSSIEEIARAAIKMGYEYVGIADHTKFLAIEHGLNEKQLERRNKEIDKINSKLKTQNSKLRILKGCEANIMADGSIDIKDEALAKLDFVIAGVHSQFKMPKEKMTERIIKAMKNPNVDIVSHPTGRILKRRDEYEIDFDEILKAAKETGTVLEINAYPDRLDLKDANIKKAKESGVKMVINTDAHQINQMRFIEYGVSQARRGWAEKGDIINCWPVDKLLKNLKR